MKFNTSTVLFMAGACAPVIASARPLALSRSAFLTPGRGVSTAATSASRFASSGTRPSSGLSAASGSLPVKCGEEVMSQKKHGTSDVPVQSDLLWGCDRELADRICNFNRHYAEHAGYWATTKYLSEVDRANPTDYYDSNTGKLLFTAPVGRSMDNYIEESNSHGWPSFRDEEVNWDYVRCLPNGECVSVDGTHLGHNLPDSSGNRYCINLVCVAGKPV
mmetsp:Transcript_44140/g.86595  ORF Transcript_44140/g.86595 Transcript_44140/m.86595 type:complete len:219 (+) Transcript_44140:44-700(+)